MRIVSNAGPLIALARINQLDLLKNLYNQILIPKAVQQEVLRLPHKPGSFEIANASWVRLCGVKDHLAVELLRERLDKGESEAIVLAIEQKADLLLIDEARGRYVADARAVRIVGTLGILILAKKQKIISELRPFLEKLTQEGFRMSINLYQKVLGLAGEI